MEKSTRCLFCNSPLTEQVTDNNPQHYFQCTCPTCGEYRVSNSTLEFLLAIWKVYPKERILLTRALCGQTDQPLDLTIDKYFRLVVRQMHLSANKRSSSKLGHGEKGGEMET